MTGDDTSVLQSQAIGGEATASSANETIECRDTQMRVRFEEQAAHLLSFLIVAWGAAFLWNFTTVHHLARAIFPRLPEAHCFNEFYRYE
jgi:hypothetical protein